MKNSKFCDQQVTLHVASPFARMRALPMISRSHIKVGNCRSIPKVLLTDNHATLRW